MSKDTENCVGNIFSLADFGTSSKKLLRHFFEITKYSRTKRLFSENSCILAADRSKPVTFLFFLRGAVYVSAFLITMSQKSSSFSTRDMLRIIIVTDKAIT